jgi:hypothetical protein
MRALIAMVVLVMGVIAVAAADTLVLRNGRRAECEVLGFSADAVRIRRGGEEQRDVRLADVDYVEFGELAGEEEAKRKAVETRSATPLIGYWVKRQGWLGRPRSPAGELGLLYAGLLLAEPTPDRMVRAEKVYEMIESGDWSVERRGRAKAGRLRLLIRQGKVAEARPEAERLLKESEDARVVIELRQVLADAAAEQLRVLVAAHPRWEEEEGVRVERGRWFHEALSGYLHGHVFHGAEEDLAARGLWAAVQLYAGAGEREAARACAEDLVKLYAGAAEASAAAGWLAEEKEKEGGKRTEKVRKEER